MAVLAQTTGRRLGNVSRTLKTLSHYGQVGGPPTQQDAGQNGGEGGWIAHHGNWLRSRVGRLGSPAPRNRRRGGMGQAWPQERGGLQPSVVATGPRQFAQTGLGVSDWRVFGLTVKLTVTMRGLFMVGLAKVFRPA